LRSTQTPLQSVNPGEQIWTQVPNEQVCLAAQALPQLPQFLESVEVLAHTSAGVPTLQVELGVRHWQLDAEQTWAGTQRFPQLPQFEPLVDVSTHVPEAGSLGQSATGAGLHTQVAARQVPRPQSRPQAPQLAASVCWFTHLRPQVSGWAAGHSQIGVDPVPALQLAPALQEVLHLPQ